MMTEGMWDQYEDVLVKLESLLGDLSKTLEEERQGILEFHLEKIKSAYRKNHEKLSEIQSAESTRFELFDELKKQAGSPRSSTVEDLLTRGCSIEQSERIRNRLFCIRSVAQIAQAMNDDQRQYVLHSLESIKAPLMMIEELQGHGGFKGYSQDGNIAGPRGHGSLRQSI
jgi:hypothetical protein